MTTSGDFGASSTVSITAHLLEAFLSSRGLLESVLGRALIRVLIKIELNSYGINKFRNTDPVGVKPEIEQEPKESENPRLVESSRILLVFWFSVVSLFFARLSSSLGQSLTSEWIYFLARRFS